MPLPHSSFGQIGYASTTSAGMVNSMGLGIEKPKHDLGWPSLRPLFRDSIIFDNALKFLILLFSTLCAQKKPCRQRLHSILQWRVQSPEKILYSLRYPLYFFLGSILFFTHTLILINLFSYI